MTVPVQIPVTTSTANGLTTVFPFGFMIADEEDLAVTVDGVLQTSGYTVSGVGNPSGGDVTFDVAPANGAKVIRYLAPVLKRETNYTQFGDWMAAIVNLDMDRMWLALQAQEQDILRALKLPVDTIVDQVLTQDAAARALKYVGFDADGNVAVLAGSFDLGNVGTVNVKDFGVTGDGATDDTAAIQTAVDFAREVYFPPGTYKITSSIIVPSNTTIRCAGNVTIDISGAASGSTAFYSAGSFGSPVSLSGNASVGATSLSVAAGAESAFAADDWIQIYSTSIYDTGWTAAPIGEIVQVASTASGTINLKSPLAGGAYNTADTAQIRKCNFVENVRIIGGNFIGNSTPTISHIAVRFEVAFNCHVENSKARYCNGTAFALYDALFSSVRGVHVEDALRTGSGYGVDFCNTSQDCSCVDSTFIRVRHAVTNGLTSGGKGVVRRITHQNLKCYNTINTGDAFDTHANGEDIQFVNCISYDSSSIGFNLECGSATLVGCRAVRSAGDGFNFSSGTTVKESEFSASNCSSDYAGAYGFRLGIGSFVNSSASKKLTLNGCSANNAGASGIYMKGNASCTLRNVQVNGGYFSGANASAGGCYVDDYVSKFVLSGGHYVANTAASTGIQVNGANISDGIIGNNLLEFSVSSASGSCLLIRKCNNISVVGNVGIQPSSSGYGLRVFENATLVYVSGNNFDRSNVPGDDYISTLTIAAGVITLPHGGDCFVVIDTEAAAATDDLDTINGGVLGQVITLQQNSSAREPTIKDTTGNLRLAGDFIMTALQDSITLKYNGTSWIEIARADIA